MMKQTRVAAAAACVLSLACFSADAQVIGSGHVMGNGTSSPAAPTDTPLIQIMNQSGSGLGTGVAAGLAGRVNATGGFATTASSITLGNCLAWGSGGISDSGQACQSPSLALASGSAQNTTANCTASSPSIALGSAIDFANGQGIALEHCGSAFSGAAPTGLAVSMNGVAGSTTYSYRVACVDANGGVGVPVTAVTITNGNATLGTVNQSARSVNFNSVTWSTSCPAVAVWRNSAGAGYHLIAVSPSAIVQDQGLPTLSVPWIPDTPPAAALNDRMVATILSGGGSTTLTLSANAGASVTGAYARHDDTAALNAYFSSTTGAVVPPGTYNVEPITLPTTLASLSALAPGGVTLTGWGTSSTISAANMPTGFSVSNLAISEVAPSSPALSVSNTSGCTITNNRLSGGQGIYLSSDTGCTVSWNKIPVWWVYGIHDLSGVRNTLANNSIAFGQQPTWAVSIMSDGTSYSNISNNIISGGTYFGINLANGTASDLVQGNHIVNSYHEALHIAGPGSNNSFNGNYVNSGSVGIDYCVSLSDDNIAGTTQTGNSITNNYLYNCGISSIAVQQLLPSGIALQITVISDNVIISSNADNVSNTPDIVLAGSGIVETVVAGNSHISGTVNYLVAEQNLGTGIPSNTKVGSMYGFANSGKASLSGSGSIVMSGGSTGL